MTPDQTRAFDLVIVGGGASGTLVAIHALQGGAALRIAMVHADATPGRGVAYSTTRAEHLLNVVAAKMSAFDGDPSHFVRHLLAQRGVREGRAWEGDAATVGGRFAPRREYARYLQSTLAASPGAQQMVHVHSHAIDVEPGDEGHLVVLASGERLAAPSVALAIGNEARALPLPAADVRGEVPTVEAWDYEAVAGIRVDDDVCILGSGLSMVDAVVTLAANGHQGRIQVLSRHGLTPLAHAVPGTQHVDSAALQGLSMRALMHELRRHARGNQVAGLPWQWTLDALRHHTQALWVHAGSGERSRFLRHAARAWDIHRHRIAPEVAATLGRLSATGQLQVHAGRARALDAGAGAGAATLRFRPRGGFSDESLAADVVVNATGIETALARTRRPLLEALSARGVVAPGPLGLGVSTATDGTLLDRDGQAQAGLFALGALRIGELWETIAVPDIRGQAESIAGAVFQRREGGG